MIDVCVGTHVTLMIFNRFSLGSELHEFQRHSIVSPFDSDMGGVSYFYQIDIIAGIRKSDPPGLGWRTSSTLEVNMLAQKECLSTRLQRSWNSRS